MSRTIEKFLDKAWRVFVYVPSHYSGVEHDHAQAREFCKSPQGFLLVCQRRLLDVDHLAAIALKVVQKQSDRLQLLGLLGLQHGWCSRS